MGACSDWHVASSNLRCCAFLVGNDKSRVFSHLSGWTREVPCLRLSGSGL